MEEGDRRHGGRYNFDQSLSHAGAAMAARGGELPPELREMAIPYKRTTAGQSSRTQQEYVILCQK